MRENRASFTVVPLTLFLVTLLTFPFVTRADELAIGKRWYERRAEEATGLMTNPRVIDRAIFFLHRALSHQGSEEEAGILLLKSYYFKGKFATQEPAQKRKIFGHAKALGEALLTKYPNSPGLRLYYAANLGKWAEYSGVLAAAESGIADKIRENAEKILALDPQYGKGAGYYLLGAIHFKAPYIPFLLSWPDNRLAIANLRKALEINPDSLGAKLFLAQALLRQGDEPTAFALLEAVSSATPRSFHLLEDRDYVEEARVLLKKHRQEHTAAKSS